MAKKKTARKKTVQKVPFHFIKSELFRVIHADGAWGGVGPHGDTIQMALYSERFPIPRSVDFEIEDGTIKGESNRTGLTGIVREVEIEVIMDLSTATSLKDWLEDKIQEVRKRQAGK